MKPLIIFDLDGPLLDGRERHYACYCGILRDAKFDPVPLDEYWHSKRTLVTARDLLARSGADGYYSDFKRIWTEQIETEEMLALDLPQEGAMDLLRKISRAGHAMVIATLRQHPERARGQLQRLGILDFIGDVLVVPHREGAGGKAARVLAHARVQHVAPLIWVGDTEVDSEAALKLGVPCALLSTGVRSGEVLSGLPSIGVFASLDEIPSAHFDCR